MLMAVAADVAAVAGSGKRMLVEGEIFAFAGSPWPTLRFQAVYLRVALVVMRRAAGDGEVAVVLGRLTECRSGKLRIRDRVDRQYGLRQIGSHEVLGHVRCIGPDVSIGRRSYAFGSSEAGSRVRKARLPWLTTSRSC